MSYATQSRQGAERNRLYNTDRPVHAWYRFPLSFPPHLVRQYLERFGLTSRDCVLDPFCGTGTTLVECKKHGISSVGLEANPVVHFAACTKTDWSVSPVGLETAAVAVADRARQILAAENRDGTDPCPGPLFAAHGPEQRMLRRLTKDQTRLLIARSISPLPLHKSLVLRDQIQQYMPAPYHAHARLAYAKQLVSAISNLRFGPEVGIGRIKEDAPVVDLWLSEIRTMAADLRRVRETMAWRTEAVVHCADARQSEATLPPRSVDTVITSPPYPNEKDYSRATRLEAVLLDFLHDQSGLRAQKRQLLRSNTRNVYRTDDDDRWITDHPRIQDLADAIEARRLELGKTSGFEKQYARVVRLYFGGLARHLAGLRAVLRPGARLAYVVGDQASYFRIPVRTGEILTEIAEALGYSLDSIDLFRTRLATATRTRLREEVVVLRWRPDGRT